jgi:ABC-type polysaccharide/polyol phosphate export permease
MFLWRRLRPYVSTSVRFLHISLLEASSQYQGTRLGLLWIPLSTLIFTAMLALVFRHSDTMPFYEFFLYVLSGYSLWRFIQASVVGSTDIIQNKLDFAIHNNLTLAGLFGKLLVDRLFEYALNLGLLVVATVLLAPQYLGLNLLLFPLFLLIVIAVSVAVAYLVNILTVFVPDMAAVIQAGVRFVLFASPIFWSPANGTDFRLVLATYNPVAYFLGLARQVFGVEPLSMQTWLVAIAITGIMCLIGFITYRQSNSIVTNIK